ncbi:MAG TPA: hypothetical protein VKI44_03460 [Acetobacteraceae bacterium]|nr:hypothetical protein [Acetobacteraceae bacterium]
MRQIITVSLAATTTLVAAFCSQTARAEDNAAALAKALPEASVPLHQGFVASEREGKPISGKYELEDGALQLSVYTARDGKFIEVVVDHKSGAIKKAETITDADDLKHAKDQNEAMAVAKVSLSSATMAAASANTGYIAVQAIPTIKNGHPVAEIKLMKSEATKEVEQKLD